MRVKSQDSVSRATQQRKCGSSPSRSTEVMTMYPTPHREIASAVFSGSCTSRGGGARDVLMAQNRHPRVHVSPMSCRARERGFISTSDLGVTVSGIARAHHDGRSCVSLVATPALSDVGAARLFTHGVQLESAQILLDLVVAGRGGDLGLEVARQPRTAGALSV